MRIIRKIIVHCAYTPVEMDIGVVEIDDWHRHRTPPFREIGYHDVIRRNGEIERGRDYAVVGAHAKGWNARSIGICLVGGKNGSKNEDASNYSLQQYLSLYVLLSRLRKDYPDAEILGHCDLPGVTKTCPCFDVRAFISGATI
jgi:N-acetylmuramoyl-L-alanine amidase